MSHKAEIELGGRTFSIETGKIAKQANGAVWIQYGDTVVVVKASRTNNPQEKNFLPRKVD
jgi:polyribonucleotide nucleotidyltransferase